MSTISANLDSNLIFQFTTLLMLLVLTLGVALNARGPVKTALSWVLFLVNVVLIVTFGVLRMNTLDQLGPKVVEPTSSVETQSEATPVSLPVVASSMEESSSSVEAISSSEVIEEPKVDLAPVRKNLLALAKKGQSLANETFRFQIGDLQSMSSSEYEDLISRANLLNNRTLGIQRKYQRVSNKELLNGANSKLRQGISALRSAGSAVRGFFNAENASEEDEFRAAYQSKAQAAIKLFKAARSKM